MRGVLCWLLWMSLVGWAWGQQAVSNPGSVPPMIRYAGNLANANGKPLSGLVGVTFALYTSQQGGAPLWLETQNVQADQSGHYSVALGSSSSQGLPPAIFTSGEARWLEVQPQGQPEQPRVLLMSVPYAFEAGDAQTLGGLPPSAFVNTSSAGGTGVNSGLNMPPLSGGGKAGFIAEWKTATKLTNSKLFQNSAGNVGLGTTTPAAQFDVNGTGDIRNTLTLFPNGSAPTLTVNGTAFSVSNSGMVSFISAQTFPGTGTITGVAAGTDLTGGGSSGNVTLNLDTTKVPQLASANSFTGNQTVNGNVSGTQLISTVPTGTSPLQVASTTQVPNLNASFLDGFPASAFQASGAYATLGANTFSGAQTITGANLALDQTAGATDGVITMGGTSFLHACCASGGSDNTFVGQGAGNFSITGSSNTALGWNALAAETSGNANIAVGTQALGLNTTGFHNIAMGVASLGSNTAGGENVGIGTDTLNSNSSGNNNTALGEQSLANNTTGAGNVAAGYLAGVTTNGNNANTTGSNNTFLGFQSGPGTTTQLSNATAIGANALVSEINAVVLGGTGANAVNVGIGTATPAATLDVHGTGNFTGLINFASGQTFPGTGTVTGVTAGTDLLGGGSSGNVTLNVDTTKVPQLAANNSFTGNQSVTGNISATGTVGGGVINATTGFNLGGSPFAFGSFNNQNAFLGFSGNSTTGGGANTATGYLALHSNIGGSYNTANGDEALFNNTGGVNNTATGFNALFNNTNGGFNTANGYLALYDNTTGLYNTATGVYALGTNTASGNTATGYQALASNTTGSENNASGYQALYSNTTGFENNASGYLALYSNTTGVGNEASGYQALYNNTGSNNAAVGVNALLENTSGSENTATGGGALYVNTTGSGNTAVGNLALQRNVTGSYNTALGNLALQGNVTGSYNTALGYNATTSGSLSNATAIGAGALVSENNALVLGGTGSYAVKVGIGTSTPSNVFTIAQNAGQAISDGWATYSSRRWKTNIHTLHGALTKVEQLRGVSYDLKANGKHEVGVIAEEVGAVVPEVVTWDNDGRNAQSVDYSRLTALLIEAVKQQQREIDKLKSELRATRQTLQQVKTQVANATQTTLTAVK